MEPERKTSSYGQSSGQYAQYQHNQAYNDESVTVDHYRKAFSYLARDFAVKVIKIANTTLPNEIKIEKLEKIKNKISSYEKIISLGQQELPKLIIDISRLEVELKYAQNDYNFVSFKSDKDFTSNAYELYQADKKLAVVQKEIDVLKSRKIAYTHKPSQIHITKSLQAINNSIELLKKERPSPTSDNRFTNPYSDQMDRSYSLYLNAYEYLDSSLRIDYLTYKIDQICKIPHTNKDKIAKLEILEAEIKTYLGSVVRGQSYLLRYKSSVNDLILYAQNSIKKIRDHIKQLENSPGYKTSVNQPSYVQTTFAKPMQQQSMNPQATYQTVSQSSVQEKDKSPQAINFNLDKANLIMDNRVIEFLGSKGDSIQNMMDKIKQAHENQIEGFKIKFKNESSSKSYENALNDLAKMHKNRYQSIETLFEYIKKSYFHFLKFNTVTNEDHLNSVNCFKIQFVLLTENIDFKNSEGILRALVKIYLNGLNQPSDFPKEPANFIVPEDVNLRSAVNRYLDAKINHDYASIFELEPGYTEEDVTKKFRTFSRKIHPDMNPGYKAEATVLFAFFQNIAEYLKKTIKK